MNYNIWAIIVTYNGMRWIGKCLTSLERSSVKINIIIIDNNSSDETCEFIKSNFPDVQLIEAKQNLGFGGANNIGLKMAYERGADFFLLVNQDVYLKKDTLKLLIDAQTKNPDYDLISPVHLNGDGNKLDFSFTKYINPLLCPEFISDIYTSEIKDKIYEIKFINAACWLMNRKCVETVGGFSPAFFHYGEDNDYLNRCKYHDIKFGIFGLSEIMHDREGEIKELKGIDAEWRKKVERYIDPNNDFSMEKDLDELKKKYIKLRLKMHYNYSKIVKKEIEFYEEEMVKLKTLYLKSREKGLTFL